MDKSVIFSFLPIVTLLFYLAPAVFVIWFMVKLLKLHKEKNEILRTIAEKLNK